jgi:hypothetical protein
MLDHCGLEARLRGNHNRWHLKRNLQKAGCKFCMELGGPEAIPDPIREPLVIRESPATSIEPKATDPLYEQKRQLWKDQVWSYAANNLDASITVRLMGCSEEFFIKEVNALFGQDWSEVCSLAMIQVVSDLQTAAIRRGTKGDFRALIELHKSGLVPALKFASEQKFKTPSELSTRDMIIRFKELAALEGLDYDSIQSTSKTTIESFVSPTLSIEEGSEENVKKWMHPKSVLDKEEENTPICESTIISARADEDFGATEQIPEPVQSKPQAQTPILQKGPIVASPGERAGFFPHEKPLSYGGSGY